LYAAILWKWIFIAPACQVTKHARASIADRAI